jgi:hypothetical protein
VWKAGDAALQKPFFGALEMIFADIEICLRCESSPEEIKREGQEDGDGCGFEPAEGSCVGIDPLICRLRFVGILWERWDGFWGRFGFAEEGKEGECEWSEKCSRVDPAGEPGQESGEGEDGESGAEGEDKIFKCGEWQLCEAEAGYGGAVEGGGEQECGGVEDEWQSLWDEVCAGGCGRLICAWGLFDSEESICKLDPEV